MFHAEKLENFTKKLLNQYFSSYGSVQFKGIYDDLEHPKPFYEFRH